MFRRWLLKNFIISFAFFTCAFSEGHTRDASLSQNQRSVNSHLSLKHLEGSGVGFSSGYTTIEAFVSSNGCFFNVLIPY